METHQGVLWSLVAAGGLGGVATLMVSRSSSSPIEAEAEANPGPESQQRAEHHAAYLTPEHTMGDRQSPINILTRRARPASHQAVIHYRASEEHIQNLGHTIEVDWDGGSIIEFDGRHYELVQFHFHTPAEHLLDGITYPMEIHLVHKSIEEEGKLLVVGALFKEGDPNPLIAHVLPFVPERPGQRIDASDKIDLTGLFDADEGYYYYTGSLTTPPYSEIVNWLVLDGVHEASPEQIERIADFEGDNARHIQEAHERAVDHCEFSERPKNETL